LPSTDLEVRIPRMQVVTLERIAAKGDESVSAVLARELRDLVFANAEWISAEVTGPGGVVLAALGQRRATLYRSLTIFLPLLISDESRSLQLQVPAPFDPAEHFFHIISEVRVHPRTEGDALNAIKREIDVDLTDALVGRLKDQPVLLFVFVGSAFRERQIFDRELVLTHVTQPHIFDLPSVHARIIFRILKKARAIETYANAAGSAREDTPVMVGFARL
jgi:hypothetical protein